MSAIVFTAVLCAAFLHAAWNAVAKGGRDKTLSMAAVVLGHVPIALAAILYLPMPAAESWPLLLLSAALHLGYQLFLLNSYRLGDLTQVYPIARGSAPILVALVSVLFLGVALAPLQWAGLLLITAGLLGLGLLRQVGGEENPAAALLALCTGAFIAGYSLVDGLGARLSGSAVAFYAWSATLNALLFVALLAPRHRGLVPRVWSEARFTFVFGGGASFAAYGLVVWAFTQAPIAVVTALRETSIVFALVIGTVALGEKVTARRVGATLVVVLGAAVLRAAG